MVKAFSQNIRIHIIFFIFFLEEFRIRIRNSFKNYLT